MHFGNGAFPPPSFSLRFSVSAVKIYNRVGAKNQNIWMCFLYPKSESKYQPIKFELKGLFSDMAVTQLQEQSIVTISFQTGSIKIQQVMQHFQPRWVI